MIIAAFLLQFIAIIAIIAFIIYTITIHRRINNYIKTLEDNLKDYQAHIIADIKFRNNINDAVNTCSNLITLCNNTNFEVISKLKNTNKDRDNKYNNLITRITELNNLVIKLDKVMDEIKKEAKNSYNNRSTMECSGVRAKRNTKLKTAKNKEI